MNGVHELVLVHIDGKPAFYARIEKVAPDVKVDWWRVTLLILTIPRQVYTWILQQGQIDGEPFTMGGTPIFLEKVPSPVAEEPMEPEPPPAPETAAGQRGEGGKVVSLQDRRKKE